MTTLPGQDRSHESVLNITLARVFRERCGLNAASETLQGGPQPDILIRLSQGPIIVETEFEPASTVEADALSRFGMEIDGRKIQNSFAVTVPAALRTASQSRLFERLASTTLAWQEWRSDGTSGPKLNGTPIELGDVIRRTTPPTSNLDEAVDALDEGARRAGSLLYSSPGTLGRVAKIFDADPGDEVANMASLVVINAMIFQERLASAEVAFQPVSAAMLDGRFSKTRLLQLWEQILDIDYYPIFGMARDVVQELSDVEASDVLSECANTASVLLGMGAVGRHDLAGRIFNRLIAERKLLAAFYTSIPASSLLAGLALSPDRWNSVDWSDTKDISKLRVVDPACGTGTLLMAAYRQLVQNHATAAQNEYDDPSLHKALVEKVITGADVVQAAIHLTAATLASMSPSVRFEQMQLHTLRLGSEIQEDLQGKEYRDVYLGSLEWLASPDIQSFFSATEEQMGATAGTGSIVHRPNADLVISNPPFIRRVSAPGKKEAIARVFSISEGDEDSKRAISKRTSALLKGAAANQIAGHASSFTVLADRMVNPGGRIALVLPVTALFGHSWRAIRGMLASRYEIEFVVSSHDPKLRSMSYDTGIAEALLVARRLKEGETPSGRGRFINLWRAAYQETDALALVRAVNAASFSPLLRSDGPPVGGSPIMIGGEPWGEFIDGPVDEGSWKAARWKQALVGQFASALERGEIWTKDGGQVSSRVPVAALSAIGNVSPDSAQIRGTLGAFDSYHGYNEHAQFHALWRHKEAIHQGLSSDVNAWLVSKVGKDHTPIWSQSGQLHVTRDIQYDSQRIMATHTNVRALGIRAWHTLKVHVVDPIVRSKREIALALWCNSTLGMVLHANHSNRSQAGRGMGNKGMLETMTSLDVRKLQPWQLDEAQAIWRDFRDRKFQAFFRCAIDPARIALDERLVRDLLGLGEDAVAAVANLRSLLAAEPSIHGSKEPVLPPSR